MARFYDPNYNSERDSATSGVEISDLNPEDQYDVDLRRVDPNQREHFDIEDQKERVGTFMKAVRAAEKHKQKTGIDEPTVRGKIPVSKASIDGVELPSLRGRNYGPPGAGATEYAHKPKPNFGKSFI